MFVVLIIIHVVVALLLVLSIMLQSGQAGGLSGAFGGGGGGGAQSVLGRGASSFLTKATAYLAAGFMVICFALAFVQSHRSAADGGGGRNIIREQFAPSEAAPPPETGAPATGAETPIGVAPAGEEGTGSLPLETGDPAETVPAQGTEVPSTDEPAAGN